jgi:polysaccharide deacetylase family protein (PEP-CTERM system associated)
MSQMTRATGCLTVDWEDFGQLNCWYRFGSIPKPHYDIERQTNTILELFDDASVRATFFVLGMLAKDRPDLVRRIHAQGHEIAIHGSNHIPLTKLNRDAARRDISDAIHLVSDITGTPIHGFRAPIFSVTKINLYVLDLLAELGISYDSSIFPKLLPRYGISGFAPEPRYYQLPEGGTIVELPLTIVPWAGSDWPVSGGGYVRLLPKLVLGSAVRRLQSLHRPLILYTHPYEYDTKPLDIAANFPANQNFSPVKRQLLNLKWNLFRKSFLDKVRYLTGQVRFSTCKEKADEIRKSHEPVRNNTSQSLLG